MRRSFEFPQESPNRTGEFRHSGFVLGRRSDRARAHDAAEQLRMLETMHGRLVGSFSGWLSGRVRGAVDLRLQQVEQVSFRDYIATLGANCNAFLMGIQDAEALQVPKVQGIINIGRELSFFLVDRLFGGREKVEILERTLTPVERLAVRVVAERLMTLIGEVWEEHVSLELALEGFESDPAAIRSVSPDAPVLVAHIGAYVGGVSSNISICIPTAGLEGFFADGLTNGFELFAKQPALSQDLAGAEPETVLPPIEIAARLPEFHLPMRALLDLCAGSVLATGIPVNSKIEVLVEEQPLFTSVAGRVGDNLAVRVVGQVGESDPSIPLPKTPESLS